MSNVVSLVKETIVDALDKLGYELVDIEYEKQYGQMTLTVYIYKDGGVTLDDCETVSRTLNGSDITIECSKAAFVRPLVKFE